MARVTLGIATYNRDTYLDAAIRSSLAQDYDDFEVLVVCDGSTNAKIEEVLAGFDDARLRIVRHERNLGISAAYDTFVREGSGELIAMLGDDDVCIADRLRRQVEVFDTYPETGIVHGDAVVIDADGKGVTMWTSAELDQDELLESFFRVHNKIVDPSRMVHRRVYEAVGGYDPNYPIAQDFEFWLRALEHFRFRHCPGGPIVGLRRHGENASDGSALAREIDDVERALEGAIERFGLRRIVPEIRWDELAAADAERLALLRLADLVDQRDLPLGRLAARLRARGLAGAAAFARAASSGDAPRLMVVAYGWNDSGGGTAVPRQAAKELARRGWDVTVFHAAVRGLAEAAPYAVRAWEEDGVRLIGVHNRPSTLLDHLNPDRELDDPPIRSAFANALAQIQPDVVHFHNLHNLGASLLDEVAARGIPSLFSAHNYWLICPRAYLMTGAGAICPGPGDSGGDCARCTGNLDRAAYQRRLAEIRVRAENALGSILAPSASVRRTLLNAGYRGELIDVVRQAMPQDDEIWASTGRDRAPGRVGPELTVGFLGSAYAHKGPQLLLEAAQLTSANIRVQIHGEIPQQLARQLALTDRRGVLELRGPYSAGELPERLASIDAAALPSIWWDCAPLAAAECRAARLPLVVPRLGGLAEVIEDEHDGLAFDALDAHDLARQLDRLAGEPGLLERLQSNITEPRSFSAYIDELEAYYRGARPGRREDLGAEPAVLWQGEHELALSLSIVNREVTERLPGRVQRANPHGRSDDPPLAQLAEVEVRHQWPPDLSPAHAGRLALIQPWEFGAIPTDWIEPIRRNADELWVPSEYVRSMYIAGGIDPELVVTIPNGVDEQLFRPDGERYALDTAPGVTRFLFHGGLIWRKGPDVLLGAWREAFSEREDVVLVVKTVGSTNVYRGSDDGELLAYARSGATPRVLLIEEELTGAELASLYRACDVFVHPYRGEGFAMGVLEAMACGLPVIVTAGGPTDEFCPPQAGWRINSGVVQFPSERVDRYETVGRPWLLEPEQGHLATLLREAASDPAARKARGAAGLEASRALGWDRVAELYGARIRALAGRRPKLGGPSAPEPYPLEGDGAQLLAVPAWRGTDSLGELLLAWCTPAARASGATLVLLADPTIDGASEELEAHVLAAAAQAGADLAEAGDINVLMQPQVAERDARLHAAIDAYIPLHAGCPGHERWARERGTPVLGPGELPSFLEALLGLKGAVA